MRQMKRGIPALLLMVILAACGGGTGGSPAEELALAVRGEYLDMTACTAVLDVTADYGQRVYDYTIDVSYVKEGESVLTVTAPEEIAGVTARINRESVVLEYDGVRWETGDLDGNGMSPVDAVPVVLEYAREGFMAECGMEDWEEKQVLRVVCRDPEGTAGTGLECSLWFDPESHAILRAELSQDGFVVIQCVFTQFEMVLPEG